MAVVIPYGDAEAHGSICDSLSFRRSRGGVILQKKPRVKQPNTEAQQDQKQWFKDIWDEWGQLAPGQLKWLKDKATEEQTFPANYYFDKYKDEHGPSGVHNDRVKSIDLVSIDNPIGANPIDIVFLFWWFDLDLVRSGSYNQINDNQNIWVPSGDEPAHEAMAMEVARQAEADPLTIPDDYSMAITQTNYDDTEDVYSLKFPEIVLPDHPAVTTIYFDNGMSMYHDVDLEQFWKFNDVPYDWPPEA